VISDADHGPGGRHDFARGFCDALGTRQPGRMRRLVVECVLTEGGAGASFAKLLDVRMLVVVVGLERTEAEYLRLIAAHGFQLTRVVTTAGDIAIVEGVPA
jgi:O-methyltransferase domain